MKIRFRLITRSLALASLLSLTPVSFGQTASNGVAANIVRSEACAEGEDCCSELFSFCGDRPNMTPCKLYRSSGG